MQISNEPSLATKINDQIGASSNQSKISITKSTTVLKNFIKSLQVKQGEFELDYGTVKSFKKIELFGSKLNADIMLANTLDGKLYVLGLTQPENDNNQSPEEASDSIEIFDQEIEFDGEKQINLLCETEDLLILASSDNKLILVSIVDNSFLFRIAQILHLDENVTSISTIESNSLLLVGTENSTVRSYEIAKLTN